MRLDVALLPSLIREPDTVCIVVDVLRASTSIVTLLESGAVTVIPAATIEEGRALHERFPQHLLCGERGGLPPPGFDYGNSPVEFSKLPVDGRAVILATSNGTRLLSRLSGTSDAPAALVGALVNREAAAATAVRLAREHGCGVTIVAASAPDGASIALEDALGAGAIAEAALRSEPSLEASDAALFARDAFLSRAGDLPSALATCRHGRELIEAGLGEDVAYCARLDVSRVVPRLGRGEDGVLTLSPSIQERTGPAADLDPGRR